MTKAKLTLRLGNSEQAIEMYPYNPDASIVDTVVHSQFRVYQDQKYNVQIELEDFSDVNTYHILLNDEIVQFNIDSSGCINIALNDNYVFSQCYGYARFQVVYFKGKQKGILESPFISVMVRKGIRNDSVSRMTEFIYNNNSILLSNRSNTAKDDRNGHFSTNRTIEAKLALLGRIIGVLESNYSYFKVNSRFKTVHIEKTDYFDKLQFVSSATIQYIAQHPDELRRTNANTGIVIGGHRYQPEKTLITQNTISYDISENRAILGFIERLSLDTRELRKEIQKLICANSYDTYEEEEYVSSTYYIYKSTIDVLRSMEGHVEKYIKRILAVKLAYSNVFNIDYQCLIKMPNPTAVFLSVPQYKQLFDCMNEWLKHADIGLEPQNQILGLKMMSEIYERYVLLKLIQFISNKDYKLEYADRIIYEFTRRTLYRNTLHNNEFVFVRGKELLTLYYQPVLFSGSNDPDNGIGLYRNNTYSADADSDSLFSGEYYTPDYVIKYQNPEFSGARYFILDAKYSTKESVLSHQLPKLVFKYIFSISPDDLSDKIVGLYIINGQSDLLNDSATNIYDRSRNEGKIMPRAEIITLTENSQDNDEIHRQLLTSSLGRFL